MTPVAATQVRRLRTLCQAGDGSLALYQAHAPDEVIPDICMPVMGGLEMAYRIKATNARTHVIVTTACSDVRFFLVPLLPFSAFPIGQRVFPADFALTKAGFPSYYEASERPAKRAGELSQRSHDRRADRHIPGEQVGQAG